MRVGGECDGNLARATGGEKLRVRIELAHRFAEPGGRYLNRNAGSGDRIRHRPVIERRRTEAEDLDKIGMRERIEQPATSRGRKRLEVQPPRFLDTHGIGQQTLLPIHAQLTDVVHGAEQVVPRIGRQELACVFLAARHVVHLEPELHRQPTPARGHDRLDVRLDVVHATLRHVRHAPQRPQLLEVVAVLREPDLVHAGSARRLDERIDRRRVERELLIPVAEMHVVVDDHSSAATRSRSPTSVILISFGSPSTTVTRPPRASTREEQSLAAATSPFAYASRTTEATNACGVCTALSSSRFRVSRTRPSSSTRLIVSASGSPGNAPSQPSLKAVNTRSITSSDNNGRAAS